MLLVASARPASSSAAHAFDPAAPAQLNVQVRNDDGKPLPGVDVTSNAPGDVYGQRPTSHALTDSAGVETFEVARPETLREPTWDIEVELSKPGYIGQSQHIRSFPGALVDREWTLHKECKTLIRLLGPNDEPVAGTQFYLAADGGMNRDQRTDARGEYLYIHPPWPEGFGVGFDWDDTRHCPDEPVVTLRYAASELPRTLSPRQVDLRVLTDDGQPAAGWFLISDAVDSGGGGIGGGEPTEFYHCRHLQHLGTQAEANVLLANDLLFVVSPAGAPFRFRLNPAAWPERGDEVHRLTLTISPERERHAGQLTWQDGQPIGNVPLVVEQTGQTNLSWYDPAGNRRFNYHALWQAVADDGARIEPVHTDAMGRYELPYYFGGQSQFDVTTHGYWSRGLGSQSPVVIGRSSIKPLEYREITIVFRDEQGDRIENVEIASFKAFRGIKGIAEPPVRSATVDRHGHHIFVPVEVDQIKLETKSAFWQPHLENREVPPHDVEIEIVLPESTRRKVLAGVVLDPDGQPVPGVTLRKLNPPAWRRHRGTPYTGSQVTTDGLGRFSFDKLPQQNEPIEGQLAVSRRGRHGKADSLPGWIDEVPFSVDSDDLTIRLKPGGTVRVLLPPDGRTDYRVSIAGLAPIEGPMTFYKLHYDPTTHTMLARSVRPGRYQLWVWRSHRESSAEAPRPPVEVAVGRETTIDLRQEKFQEPAPRRDLPIAIAIERDGQPIQGAQVFVYSLPRFDESLIAELSSERCRCAQAGNRAARKSRNRRDRSAAKTAVERRCRSARDSARSIEQSLEQYFEDGLEEAGVDVSDEGGRAWFRAFPGGRYIAVATAARQVDRLSTLQSGSAGRPAD